MNDTNTPSKTSLPSTGKLIKSTILAAAIAAVLLVTVVMPAEYGIDPTGFGKITGLKKMGEIKTSLSKDAAKDVALELETQLVAVEKTVVEQVSVSEDTTQTHEKTITLLPDGWTEIKLVMEEGASVKYAWFTNAELVNYDTHGDSKPLDISYHGYEKGSKQRDEGVLTAKFSGNHGWYWRNRTDKAMTITLSTSGTYQDIFIMK